MADECRHAEQVRDVKPSARGCEECLKTGSEWVHLRLCRTCGHVGCCDDSPNKHATRHFHETRHPVIEGYDPPEGWGWCYVDEIFPRPVRPADAAGRPDSAVLLGAEAEDDRGLIGAAGLDISTTRQMRNFRDDLGGLDRQPCRALNILDGHGPRMACRCRMA